MDNFSIEKGDDLRGKPKQSNNSLFDRALFGVGAFIAHIRAKYLEGFYSVHVKVRYLHDKAYQKGPNWYKKWSDKSYSNNVHKATLGAFVFSFVFFSILQSIFPYLFNPGRPNVALAGANNKTWTTQSDFETGTTRNNIDTTSTSGSAKLTATGSFDNFLSGVTLNSIVFTDSNTGYAVAPYGRIIKTTDGGNNWKILNTGSTKEFYEVFFVDSNTGYAVGQLGVAKKTTNAGETWSDFGSWGTTSLMTVFFVDANNGFIGAQSGNVYYTINGGTNWTQVNVGNTNTINSVYFPSASIGYAAGSSGTIAKTTDGGLNWSLQNSLTAQHLMSTNFTSTDVGYAVGYGGVILKTVNGGTNWTTITISGTHRRVKFTDANTGYIVGDSGLIRKTTNAGVNWNVLTAPAGTGTLMGMYPISATNVVAVGFNANVIKTTDGTNWSTLNQGLSSDYVTTFFTSEETGYIGGGGHIRKTTNGGKTWGNAVNQPNTPRDIYFTDTVTGYLVGDSGMIRKTTDGGTNWVAQTSGVASGLKAIHFTDANTAYVVGDSGTVLKTTNGGSNWTILNPGTSNHLKGVHFSDPYTGYVVGASGVIKKTTDAGANWATSTSGVSNDLEDVHFFGATGYVCGSGGVVRKTTNSGSSWNAQTSGTTQYLTSIEFTDANTGYFAGGSSFTTAVLSKTTNGGTNWNAVFTDGIYGLQDIRFSGANRGYSVGGYGHIVKYTVSYNTPGTISDLKFDSGAGKKANWKTLDWITNALPSDTTVVMKARTSDDNSNWSAWSTDFTQSQAGSTDITNNLNISNSRYIDVYVTLTTTNPSNTPVINSIATTYDTLENPINSNLTLTKTAGSDTNIYDSSGSVVTSGVAGGYTNESAIKVTATGLTCTDCATAPTNLRPEVEIKQTGTAFTGTGTVTAEAGNNYAIITGLTAGQSYHIQVRAIDDQGRASGWTSYGNNAENVADFTVEQTAPTGTVTIDGGTYTTTATPNLTISGSDAGGSNLSKMRFSNNGSTWSDWETYAASRANWDLTQYGGNGNDGSKTVYAQFIDNAGNVSGQELDTTSANFSGTFEYTLPGNNHLEMQKVVDLGTGTDGELIVDGTTAGLSTLAGAVISDGGYTGPFDVNHPLVLDTVIARTNRVYNFTNLILQNSAVVTHTATVGAFTGYEGLTVKASGNISIDASSSINLDGKGYNDSTVKGPGTSTESGSTFTYGGTGGGYGTNGGQKYNGSEVGWTPGGSTYGTALGVEYFGSAGGRGRADGDGYGGYGGGRISLSGNSLNISGKITANGLGGTSKSQYPGGGGSGGGIRIGGNTITVGGIISAAGGGGGVGCSGSYVGDATGFPGLDGVGGKGSGYTYNSTYYDGWVGGQPGIAGNGGNESTSTGYAGGNSAGGAGRYCSSYRQGAGAGTGRIAVIYGTYNGVSDRGAANYYGPTGSEITGPYAYYYKSAALYTTSGTYTSPIRTFPSPKLFGNIRWSELIKAGTGITFEFRSGDQSNLSDGVWTSVTNNSSLSGFNNKNYYQYRVNFSSDGSSTAIVDDVSVEKISISDSITLDTQPPTAFTLSSPATNTWSTNGNPTFNWNASTGHDKYQLWIDNELNVDDIASGTTSSQPIAPLTEGNHTWTVKAVDVANNSTTASANWNYGYDATIPGAITGLTASNNQLSTINLSWNAFSDGGAPLDNYKLERVKESVYLSNGWNLSSDWSSGNGYATFTLTNASFIDDSGAPAQGQTAIETSVKYIYKITVKDTSNASYSSPQASPVYGLTRDAVAPSDPSNVVAVACDGTAPNCYDVGNKGFEIKVTWNPSTDTGTGVAKYNIYRASTGPDNPDNFTKVAEVTTPTVTFYDNDATDPTYPLNDYTTYYYRITASDGADPVNESELLPAFDPSLNTDSGTTPDVTTPSVPTGLSATPMGLDPSGSRQRVTISWNASTDIKARSTDPGSGAKEYKLYRATSENGTYSEIATISSPTLTYNNDDLDEFTYYWYKVKTLDNANPSNQSAQSSFASVRTASNAVPTVPTAVSVTTKKGDPNTDAEVGHKATITFSGSYSKNCVGGTRCLVKYEVYRSTTNYQTDNEWATSGTKLSLTIAGTRTYNAGVTGSDIIPERNDDDRDNSYTIYDSILDDSTTYYYRVRAIDNTPVDPDGGPFTSAFSVVATGNLNSGWDITPDDTAPMLPVGLQVNPSVDL